MREWDKPMCGSFNYNVSHENGDMPGNR